MQDLLGKCIIATMDGGRKAFAERNEQVEQLRRMLVQNGHYVETRAPDEASFLSRGYQLASGARTQTPPLNHAIRNLDYGENSGSFRFRFMAVEGASSYELRWAPRLEDGTLGEWTTKPFGKTKAYITITGFTPGTAYVFQVRCPAPHGLHQLERCGNKNLQIAPSRIASRRSSCCISACLSHLLQQFAVHSAGLLSSTFPV
jgi:hypothetical protein